MGEVRNLKRREGAERLEPGKLAERHAGARRQIDGDRRSWKIRRISPGEEFSGLDQRSDEERRITLFRRKKTDRRKSPFL